MLANSAQTIAYETILFQQPTCLIFFSVFLWEQRICPIFGLRYVSFFKLFVCFNAMQLSVHFYSARRALTASPTQYCTFYLLCYFPSIYILIATVLKKFV